MEKPEGQNMGPEGFEPSTKRFFNTIPSTTPPDSHVSALLIGATVFNLDFTIRSRLVAYLNTPTPTETICAWVRSMQQDFALALNRLRLIDL